VKGHQPGCDGDETRFRQLFNGIYDFDMDVGDEDAEGDTKSESKSGTKKVERESGAAAEDSKFACS
jgi:hypothetical protein